MQYCLFLEPSVRPRNSPSNKPKLLSIALGKISTIVLAGCEKGKLQLILRWSF